MNSPAAFKVAVTLHGLHLFFQSAAQVVCDTFITTYGHLPNSNGAMPDIRIAWHLHPGQKAPPPPANLAPILESELINYYGDNNRLAIRLPKYAMLDVDLTEAQVRGQITPRCLDTYGVFEDVMMISLAPLFRRRGWFPLHAFAAQAPNGHAALISGSTGAGKTTTGLALLSAGWKLLSNDSPLLSLHADQVRVLAYPGRLSAFDDSLARFPQLEQFIPSTVTQREKRVFAAETVFNSPWATDAPAGGIFFPQVTPGLETSDLAPVSPTEATLKLLPQAIESWDRSTVPQHLTLLTRLVEAVPGYNLRLAPDVSQLPNLLLEGMSR